MLFSSMTFLWVFLPVVFVLYRLVADRYRNMLLLVASMVFYAWGEPKYILLMLISIFLNYFSAQIIDSARTQGRRKVYLLLCIMINLLLLGYFKYFNFFVQTVDTILGVELLSVRNIVLPIGISFYTFQELSYVMDVYRGQTKVQKNWYKLALYVSLFPQLIAGPIVKYHDVANQIDNRAITSLKTAEGINRFIYGLSKKVLISNSMALIADRIFALPAGQMGTSIAWIGAICYALQIYFDFSGYSDMAIGLGKMFGFSFLENFDYPYLSQSIQEFWRRWHISLSTWFREYLYIPLGGNRKGVARTYINLLIVFFATGLWHGASFNFVVWGLFHGFFIIIERMFLGKWLKKNPIKILNHLYLLLVVVVGWVFFRADGLHSALRYLKVMFGFQSSQYWNPQEFVNLKSLLLIIIAVAFCGLMQRFFLPWVKKKREGKAFFMVNMAATTILYVLCTLSLASGTYNPFIYFRF